MIDLTTLTLTDLEALREEERAFVARKLRFINAISEEIGLRQFKAAVPGQVFNFIYGGGAPGPGESNPKEAR